MPSRLRPCPTTTSRRRPATTISGRPATGPGLQTAITGCPAHGLRLPTRAHSGPPATGATGITLYGFYPGYWGQYIGYYGGINYGYGYVGYGYQGGYWGGGHFNYNRSVNNINISVVHNVYSRSVAGYSNNSRVSYQRRIGWYPGVGRVLRSRRRCISRTLRP
jgi:hypothetical protein